MGKASKSRPSAANPATASADPDTPSKIDTIIADGAEAAAQGEDGGGAPLLRAKQSQAQRGSQLENAAGGEGDELDIAFISADTIKSLFDFMHVEAGDEGERNIDQVLAAQSSLEGRGRTGTQVMNQLKRGLSKEPAVATAAAQEQL